ncbi:uncharacterized protein LOC144344200 [Saccoglossus kowalevskii]
MVLLYELKLAYANCEFELQAMRHRFEALAPGKNLGGGMGNAGGSTNSVSSIGLANSIVMAMEITPVGSADEDSLELPPQSPSRQRKMSEIIDVVSTAPSTPSTPSSQRKRRTPQEQTAAVKKMKGTRT